MPLCNCWKGAFYGPDTMAEALTDWEPERFIAFLKDYPDDPVFLIIGGYFDLKLNGNNHPELNGRADRLLELARPAWQFPWDEAKAFADEKLALMSKAWDLPPENMEAAMELIGQVMPMEGRLAARLAELRAETGTPAASKVN